MRLALLLGTALGSLLSGVGGFLVPTPPQPTRALVQSSPQLPCAGVPTCSNWRRLGVPALKSMAMDEEEEESDPFTREKIEQVIQANKVVLFMKGNKLFPSCGFSGTAVRILDSIGVKYEVVNVLDDDRMRMEIKRYSQWPTIPQLYIQGEFVGGSDIMLELYQSGELAEMLEVAAAS